MQNQSLNLIQEFLGKEQIRKALPISSKSLKAKLQFEQITIRHQFDHQYKKSDKKKILKKQIEEQFRQSFKQLTREQKVYYYNKTIDYIVAIFNKSPLKFHCQDFKGQGFTRSYHLKLWKLKNIRFDHKRDLIFGQRQGIVKTYDLSNYLHRKSKSHNKQYHIFILQAINNKPYQSMRTVHFGFKNLANYQIFAKNVITSLDHCLYQSLKSQLHTKQPIFSQFPQIIRKQNNQILSQVNDEQSQSNSRLSHTSIQNSMRPNSISSISNQSPQFNKDQNVVEKNMVVVQNQKNEQENNLQFFQIDDDNQENQIEQKKIYDNQIYRLKNIIPGYDFTTLQSQQNYSKVQFNLEVGNLKIIKNITKPNCLKLKMTIPENVPIFRIVNLLTNPQLIKGYNTQIQQFEIKTMIKSENTAIIYQKNVPYNKLYRSRDFLFLRHVYVKNQVVYIMDKSIQDPHYPPFITIVRGSLQIVWGIYPQNNHIKVVADMSINHEGYLNEIQNQALTIKYLKGFIKIYNQFNYQVEQQKSVIFNLSQINVPKKLSKNMNSPTNIQELEQQPILNYRKSMLIAAKANIQNVNQSHLQNFQEAVNELKPQQIKLMEFNKLKIKQMETKINQDGQVIIDDSFRKAKYQLTPSQPTKWQFLQITDSKHPIWKGEWKVDPAGGIIFINQKKISDQNGVLKFIISQIGKNLLSGKSILNISLPVDIFAGMSNLQLLSLSMTYAPYMMEKKVDKSPIEQLKAVVAFGISMSSTYLIMQKPFNPVLGETLQCFIQGCPLYAEQISHHPPISALYFVGRGYKISGQLQSKASLSMNSGYGSNDGVYLFEFNKGSKVKFLGPYGQVSGLIIGERKFNIIGKAYGWIEENNLFVQIQFNPKKGFFRKGNGNDYFQGFIYETTSTFMKNFIAAKKKYSPSKSEIVKEHGKIHGIWHKQIKFEEEVLLDIDVEFPLRMSYQQHPLPSHSNWREDITYRKLLQTTKAQKYKEAIEIKQRADKKLRETKGKK